MILRLAAVSALGLALASCAGAPPPARPPAAAAREDPLPRLRARAEAWLDEVIEIRVAAARFERTRRALGAAVDEGAVGRWERPPGSREAEPSPLPIAVDRAVVDRFLDEIAPAVEREPVPGHVDFEARAVVPHEAGLRVHRLVSGPAIEEALHAGVRRLDLPVVEVPPAEGYAPPGLSLDVVLAEFSTRYHGRGRFRNRAHNVELATLALDGTIVDAGSTLSFNGVVGERTGDRGYRVAPVIAYGEMVDGVGGGVCQPASTLHAAAFFAGLEIVEHTNHSRPSAYIRQGLDATVNWPNIDLVIRNPFAFPVYVQAEVAPGRRRSTITLRLWGAARPREVQLERRIGEYVDFGTRTAMDPDLPWGHEELAQEGIRGRTVYRTRTLTEGDRTWQEHARLVYPPTPRVILIGTSGAMSTY